MKRSPLKRKTCLQPGEGLSRKARLRQRSKTQKRLKTILRSPEHRAFVREQPCCCLGCTRRDIHAHHHRKGGGGGTGIKPCDSTCVPLCAMHHAQIHQRGALGAATPDATNEWLTSVAKALAKDSRQAGRLPPLAKKEGDECPNQAGLENSPPKDASAPGRETEAAPAVAIIRSGAPARVVPPELQVSGPTPFRGETWARSSSGSRDGYRNCGRLVSMYLAPVRSLRAPTTCI